MEAKEVKALNERLESISPDTKLRNAYIEINKLQAENKRLKEERVSEVRHPLDVETNKPRKWRSYCYKCGTTVKNQKYCHNCGSKLLWPKD